MGRICGMFLVPVLGLLVATVILPFPLPISSLLGALVYVWLQACYEVGW